MRKYNISDRFTTADIGLDLEADNIEELFAAGADGMFAIIFGHRPQREYSTTLKINLKASELEQLLIDWLSELLYVFDAEGLIAVDYRLGINLEKGEYTLDASVDCSDFDRNADAAQHEVKAVTYYRLKIEREGGLYRCHVVFDL